MMRLKIEKHFETTGCTLEMKGLAGKGQRVQIMFVVVDRLMELIKVKVNLQMSNLDFQDSLNPLFLIGMQATYPASSEQIPSFHEC